MYYVMIHPYLWLHMNQITKRNYHRLGIEVGVQLFANERSEAYGITALRGPIWPLRCCHRLPSLMLAYRPFGRMVTSEYFLMTVGYEESSSLLHLDALTYLSSGEA